MSNSINNTYITYDKLISMVNSYFRMTGGEDFVSHEDMEFIINLSIQDILNQSGYSYMSEFEVITKEKELYGGTYSVFKTKEPINLIHEVFDNGIAPKLEIVNTMPFSGSKDVYFRKGTNIIYIGSNVEIITVNYQKAFAPIVLSSKGARNTPIPIPYTYVPALIKMIYDNSALITFYQGDGTYSDFFSHAQSRMNFLIPQDKLTDQEKVIL